MDSVKTKKVVINGREYTVTVLPPGPEWHDETVWVRPKAGTRHSIVRTIATLEGTPSTLIGTE